MTGLLAGDRVRIVIDNATVQDFANDVLTVDYEIDIPICEGNYRRTHLCTLSSNVTVERLDPKNWPPQQGDVWSSVDPVLWFAYEGDNGDLRMVNQVGAAMSVEEFRNGYAGRLVLRDGHSVPAVASC